MFGKREEKQRTVGKANGMDNPSVRDVHLREHSSSDYDIDRWSGLDDLTRGKRKESIESGKKVGSYSSDLLGGNLRTSFDGDRLDAWAYTIDREVRNRYVPLGPPETPNKGTKLIKNGKVTSGETQSKAEKVVESRNGNEKNIRDHTVSHIPGLIKDKKGKESVDGNGSERPESKASVVSNRRNYPNDMSIKSKISLGTYRLHPYAQQRNNRSPESGFTSQGTILPSSKSGDRPLNDDSDGEVSVDNSNYTDKTSTVVDGSRCQLMYDKDYTSGCDPRSVLLIAEPKQVEEDVYKVQTSCETLQQTQKSTHIIKVPRDIVLEDRYECCCKGNACGVPKPCMQKPVYYEKSYSVELDEHFEKKRMHYPGRCMHREAFCCRDEPLHIYECCGPPSTGYLHHFCQDSPKEVHQIENHCLHSLVRTKSNEKRLAICKKVPYDCMVQVYGKSSVDHVSHSLSRSENSCGMLESRRGCHYNAFPTGCSVRPVSVIPSIRKHSKGKQLNWQVSQCGQQIHKHRPKSAIFPPDEGIKKTTSANIPSVEKKYCVCSEDQITNEQSLIAEKDASDHVNPPTESDEYHSAEGKHEYLLNKYIQRPLKKKKIMKICNCPHLHLEENSIKKFCIHQCSNNKKDSKPQQDGKSQSRGNEEFHDGKYTSQESSADIPKQDRPPNRKNEVSPDPKTRLLIKSTSALLVPNKDTDDKRMKESLRDRMPAGDTKTRKYSVGTETEAKGSDLVSYKDKTKPKLEKRHLNRKTQSTQANEKEKRGGDSEVASEKDTTNLKSIKLKNVFTKTDKDKAFMAFGNVRNRDRDGAVKKDVTNHSRSDGKAMTKTCIPKPTDDRKTLDKDKSLNLVKLYEDLVEFQKVFSTAPGQIKSEVNPGRKDGEDVNGKSPGDSANEESLRKKLRCKLALHLHQLLRISDDTVQLM